MNRLSADFSLVCFRDSKKCSKVMKKTFKIQSNPSKIDSENELFFGVFCCLVFFWFLVILGLQKVLGNHQKSSKNTKNHQKLVNFKLLVAGGYLWWKIGDFWWFLNVFLMIFDDLGFNFSGFLSTLGGDFWVVCCYFFFAFKANT